MEKIFRKLQINSVTTHIVKFENCLQKNSRGIILIIAARCDNAKMYRKDFSSIDNKILTYRKLIKKEARARCSVLQLGEFISSPLWRMEFSH